MVRSDAAAFSSSCAGRLAPTMAEATFGNIFQIAGGPSLDYVAAGFSKVDANGTTAAAAAGAFFGLNFRAGLAIGREGPGRRSRFMLGFELHPTFLGGVGVPTSAMVTLGWGKF